MNIPSQAFEEADMAGEHAHITGGAPGDVAKAAVLAAAPFIATQALDNLEGHLRDVLADTGNGAVRRLCEDALLMLDAHRASKRCGA